MEARKTLLNKTETKSNLVVGLSSFYHTKEPMVERLALSPYTPIFHSIPSVRKGVLFSLFPLPFTPPPPHSLIRLPQFVFPWKKFPVRLLRQRNEFNFHLIFNAEAFPVKDRRGGQALGLQCFQGEFVRLRGSEVS